MKRRFEVPSNASDGNPRFSARDCGGAGKGGCRQGGACVTSPLTRGILPHNLRFPSEGGMAVALWNQWPCILRDLCNVGRLLVITRNPHAVLGRYMMYPTLVPDQATGRLCDETGLLELDISTWHSACAKEERHPMGYGYSIEFFDAARQTIHKVCLTPQADLDGFLELVRMHQATGLEALGAVPLPGQGSADGSAHAAGHTPSRTASNSTLVRRVIDALAPSMEGRSDLSHGSEEATDALDELEAEAEALARAESELEEETGGRSSMRFPLNPALMHSLLNEVQRHAIPLNLVVGNDGARQSHTFVTQEVRVMGEWIFCSADDEGMHLRFNDLAELSAEAAPVRAGAEPVWRIRARCRHGREAFVLAPGLGASLDTWNHLVQERLA